jgi:hypothetical protein
MQNRAAMADMVAMFFWALFASGQIHCASVEQLADA